VAGVDVWEEPGVAGQEMGPGSVNCFVPVIVFSAFAPLSAGAVAPRPGAHQRERMALGSILAQRFYLSNHCVQRAADGQAAPVEDVVKANEDVGYGRFLSSGRWATGLAFGRGRNRWGDWNGFAFCPPPLFRFECIWHILISGRIPGWVAPRICIR
jgi:hypothetical protein